MARGPALGKGRREEAVVEFQRSPPVLLGAPQGFCPELLSEGLPQPSLSWPPGEGLLRRWLPCFLPLRPPTGGLHVSVLPLASCSSSSSSSMLSGRAPCPPMSCGLPWESQVRKSLGVRRGLTVRQVPSGQPQLLMALGGGQASTQAAAPLGRRARLRTQDSLMPTRTHILNHWVAGVFQMHS